MQWQTDEQLERQLGLKRSVHYALIYDEQRPRYTISHLRDIYELSEHAVTAAFMLRRQIYGGFIHANDMDERLELPYRNKIGPLRDALEDDVGWGYEFMHPDNGLMHTVRITPTFVYRREPDPDLVSGGNDSPGRVDLSAHVENSRIHEIRSNSWVGRENA